MRGPPGPTRAAPRGRFPPRRRYARRVLVVAIIVLSAYSSCGRDAGDSPELPATPVISTRESWAVVRNAYVRVLEEPAADAQIRGHVRRGVILAIEDRTPYLDKVDGQSGRWLAVRGQDVSGWIFGAYVDGYTTRAQAETAAGLLRGE